MSLRTKSAARFCSRIYISKSKANLNEIHSFIERYRNESKSIVVNIRTVHRLMSDFFEEFFEIEVSNNARFPAKTKALTDFTVNLSNFLISELSLETIEFDIDCFEANESSCYELQIIK